MIAADTSSMIAFLTGDSGKDVSYIRETLTLGHLILPPMVLTELLSDIHDKYAKEWIEKLPTCELKQHFWIRTGTLRRQLLMRKLKSRLGDAVIAQCCIDHDLPLITRDKDFRHYHPKLKIFG